MSTAYLLTAIFFISPAVLAIATNIAESNGYIIKSQSTYLAEKAKNPEIALATTIWIGIYFLLIALGHTIIEHDIHIALAAIPFSIIVFASIALSIIVYRALSIYKKASPFFNITLTYLAFWITWLASSYASDQISAVTGLSATEFPAAVAGISLLYTPILWGLPMSATLLCLYAITGIAVLFTPFTPEDPKDIDSKKKPSKAERAFILTSLFIGLGFSSIITIQTINKTSKSIWLENRTLDIILYSSFSSKEFKCAKRKSEKDKFTILIRTRFNR